MPQRHDVVPWAGQLPRRRSLGDVQGQEEDQKVPQEEEEGQVRLLDEEVQKDAQKVPGYLQRVLMLRLRRDDSGVSVR